MSEPTVLDLDAFNAAYDAIQEARAAHFWDLSWHWHYLLVGIAIGVIAAIAVMAIIRFKRG